MHSKLSKLWSCGAAVALVLGCCTLYPARAQTAPDAPPDGAAGPSSDVNYGYSLFNPVPDAQMRPLASDRPGKSQSPVTVDAGHFQIEADLFNFSFGRDGQTTTRQWSTPNALLKLGLSDGVDLEVIAPGAQSFEYNDRTTKQLVKASGITDTWVGAKFNLFGDDPNDGPAGLALAMIPMIKIPTASKALGNNRWEATVAIPCQISLPGDWALVVQNNDGLRANYTGQGYHGDFQGLVNISHSLYFQNLTAALEYAYDYALEGFEGHSSTVDPSLQWQVAKGLALDMGNYIGTSGKAPAENPYVGITVRF